MIHLLFQFINHPVQHCTEIRQSIVLITHDIDLAFAFADRIAVFYAGTVVETASAQDFQAFQFINHPVQHCTEIRRCFSPLFRQRCTGNIACRIAATLHESTALPHSAASKGICPVQLIYQHPEQAVNPRWQLRKVLEEGGRLQFTVIKIILFSIYYICKI